jgi:hypothetical protein
MRRLRAITIAAIAAIAALGLAACREPATQGAPPMADKTMEAPVARDAPVMIAGAQGQMGDVMLGPVDNGSEKSAYVGQAVIVALPWDPASGLAWVGGSTVGELGVFAFEGLEPDGGRMLFRYRADKAGEGVLKFGLVAPGTVLVGPAASKAPPQQSVVIRVKAV